MISPRAPSKIDLPARLSGDNSQALEIHLQFLSNYRVVSYLQVMIFAFRLIKFSAKLIVLMIPPHKEGQMYPGFKPPASIYKRF